MKEAIHIFALFVAAAFQPSLRWLHGLQALVYVDPRFICATVAAFAQISFPSASK